MKNIIDDINWGSLINPFQRIAGGKALLIGFAGLVISTILAYFIQYHYHGLLHFGPAPNNKFWCFAVEHIIVWLIPALLFYIGSLVLSKSKTRIIDILGTVAFAQLPLVLMTLFFYLKPLQRMNEMNFNLPPIEMINQPGFILGMWLGLIGSIFLIWTLIWMFYALKVSTNLKGYRLGILYCIGVFGGDMICRYIIGMCY